jgi:hypothetical protein
MIGTATGRPFVERSSVTNVSVVVMIWLGRAEGDARKSYVSDALIAQLLRADIRKSHPQRGLRDRRCDESMSF